MFKGPRVFTFLVICFLAFRVRDVVRGAPMDQNRNLQRLPTFGEPDLHHLVAPISVPADDVYNWNPLPYQDHRQGNPAHPFQEQFDQFPIHVPSMWEPEFVNPQQVQNDHLLPQQQLYNTHHLIDTFGQGMHLGNMYDSHPMGTVFTQNEYHGQASGSQQQHNLDNQPLTPPSSSPLAYYPSSPPETEEIEKEIDIGRPLLSERELDSRSERLNIYRWQRTYRENELIFMYRKIAEKWGNLKMSTYRNILYNRLNKHFAKNPLLIAAVLADNSNTIHKVAKDAGPRFKSDRSNEGKDMWTPLDFLDWLRRSPRKHAQTRPALPNWAAAWGKDSKTTTRVINNLVRYWNIPKEHVEHQLSLLNEQDMLPYRDLLAAPHPYLVGQGADQLAKFIRGKQAHQTGALHANVPSPSHTNQQELHANVPSPSHTNQQEVPDDQGELYYALQNQLMQSPPRYNPYDSQW